MTNRIQKVAVIGTGVLGTQIAIQAACFGYDVIAFDEVEGALERTSRALLAAMATVGKKPSVDQGLWEKSLRKIRRIKHIEAAVPRS